MDLFRKVLEDELSDTMTIAVITLNLNHALAKSGLFNGTEGVRVQRSNSLGDISFCNLHWVHSITNRRNVYQNIMLVINGLRKKNSALDVA